MKTSLSILSAFTVLAGAVSLSNTPLPIDQGLAAFSDFNIIQFALYLENFSSAFYRQGLANFTQTDFAAHGFDSDFYTNVTEIASNHQTHVASLSKTLEYLNATQVSECNYDFNGSTPLFFAQTATLIEGVSVSAYLSAVANLQDPSLTTVMAAILSVDARHSAFVRASIGEQPAANPFDVPLTLNEAYSLAELYIPGGCPSPNPPLNLRTFPQMSSSFSNYGIIGGDITLVTFGQDIQPAKGSTEIYAAFLTISGPIFALATRVPDIGFNVTVPSPPQGYAPIAGLTYIVLTSQNETLVDSDVLAGPASLEIHPRS